MELWWAQNNQFDSSDIALKDVWWESRSKRPASSRVTRQSFRFTSAKREVTDLSHCMRSKHNRGEGGTFGISIPIQAFNRGVSYFTNSRSGTWKPVSVPVSWHHKCLLIYMNSKPQHIPEIPKETDGAFDVEFRLLFSSTKYTPDQIDIKYTIFPRSYMYTGRSNTI